MARNASRFTPYIPLRCRLGGTSNAHCTDGGLLAVNGAMPFGYCALRDVDGNEVIASGLLRSTRLSNHEFGRVALFEPFEWLAVDARHQQVDGAFALLDRIGAQRG